MALQRKAEVEPADAERAQERLEFYVPVLVVGAGPTGLTLANVLGVLGARALLIERNGSTVSEPRAVSIDDESLRAMQAIGLINVVLPSIVPGYGSDYLMPDGRCFLTVEPTGRPFGFPRRNAFRQPRLEAQLRAAVGSFPSVDSKFGWTLNTFAQDEAGVTAHVSDENGVARRIRCDYLVGCDGASSSVRRQLGISLEGKSFAERWLIIDLESSPSDRRNTVVFCETARPCIALPGPNQTRRFEFKLHPHEREEDVLRPEVVGGLLRAHGAHANSVLVRKVVYTFHARVATRWSIGRVFLAGDAAHLTPPFAGQGMNSGLRDSINLGWKLARVTDKRMPATVLATYEIERRPHVQQMIQLALRMGRIMSPRSRLHGWLVQHAFLALGSWPAARSFFGEMKYKPKPRFRAGFMHADRLGKRRTIVGRMIAQPTVVAPDGRRVMLDELLGNGFALLGIDVAAAQLQWASEQPEIGQFNPVCVTLNPPDPSGPSTVRIASVDHYGPELEQYRGHVLLIRPDRYVAASGTVGGRNSIVAAIGALVARLQED